MSKYERTLIDIARGIDDALAGTGLAYRNRLGVRAMINDLVLALDGRAELKRLLGWFGAQGTVAEQAIVENSDAARGPAKRTPAGPRRALRGVLQCIRGLLRQFG